MPTNAMKQKFNMAATTTSHGRLVLILLAAAMACTSSYGVNALPWSQVDALLTLRDLLHTPYVTGTWNQTTNFCNLPPSPHLTLICSTPETLTYLRIVGNKTIAKNHDINQQLPSTFSSTSLAETLLAFPELRGIELTNLGMFGTLPEILNPNLELLNMSSNFFTGAIPTHLHNLMNLQVLALDNNALSGDLTNTSITSFKPLRSLSLAHNHFTGVIPDMEGLRSLKLLNLGGNAFTGSFPVLPTTVVAVHLGMNRLTGMFPESMRSMGQLQVLDVSGNAMVGTPPSFLFTLPKLVSMSLARNRFSGVLPWNMTLGKAMSVLDVSMNFFSGALPTVFLRSDVVIRFGSNCLETARQRQGGEEYCTETAKRLGIRDVQGFGEHVGRGHLVLIVAVAAAGGLCLLVALCVVAVVVARRCGLIEKESVAAPENFGSFRGIPSELLSNASQCRVNH